MKKSHAIRHSTGDRAFLAVNYIVLTIFLLIVLYPIVYVVSASFSDPKALMAGKVWLLPVNPTLEAYKATFQYERIWTGFGNSLIYAVAGTCLNIFMTIIAAYPLSRKDLAGRNAITMVFAFTMWFSGGLIPQYLLVRDLGLLDTRWAIILPAALNVWNMIITRTYFQTNIPDELLESAKLDGCNDFKFILKIAIPLSAPIIAVIALFYAVYHWNSYFNAFIYLSDRNLFPLQLILREIILLNQADDILTGFNLQEAENRRYMAELLKYSTIVVSSLPMIIAYPFVQKFFIKGIMVGAIKG